MPKGDNSLPKSLGLSTGTAARDSESGIDFSGSLQVTQYIKGDRKDHCKLTSRSNLGGWERKKEIWWVSIYYVFSRHAIALTRCCCIWCSCSKGCSLPETQHNPTGILKTIQWLLMRSILRTSVAGVKLSLSRTYRSARVCTLNVHK